MLNYARDETDMYTVVRHSFISGVFDGHTCTKLMEWSAACHYCYKYVHTPLGSLAEGVADKDGRAGTAKQRRARFKEASELQQHLAIQGPEAAWDLLYEKRFMSYPPVKRYPDELEEKVAAFKRPESLHNMALYLEEYAGSSGTPRTTSTKSAFSRTTTCSVLECYLAYRNDQRHPPETMETFLEKYTCAESWTTIHRSGAPNERSAPRLASDESILVLKKLSPKP